VLVEALGSRAQKLSVLKVVCHESWSEATRYDAVVVLKEVRYKSLALDVSVSVSFLWRHHFNSNNDLDFYGFVLVLMILVDLFCIFGCAPICMGKF